MAPCEGVPGSGVSCCSCWGSPPAGPGPGRLQGPRPHQLAGVLLLL